MEQSNIEFTLLRIQIKNVKGSCKKLSRKYVLYHHLIYLHFFDFGKNRIIFHT